VTAAVAIERADPFVTEIVRNFLDATTRQMAVTLARTAYSPVIQHNEDFSTGIFTADAELIVQGPGLAAHIIPVEACVREALAEVGTDALEPGDMIISNDPFRGGTHLPDVALIAPFFADDEIVCFVANRAHWEDIGGMVAGSMTGASTELFQEGLLIPPLKILVRDEIRSDLVRMICENTRFPTARRGDLAAQIAANRVGLRNLEEVVRRYGIATIRDVFARVMDQAEQAARQVIAAMPDGIYEYQDFNDNDGITTTPLRIRAKATVAGDTITIDFAGTDPMPSGPCKSVRSTTEAAVFATLKCLVGPDIPVNHGFFRAIEVVIPEGTFLNPVKPASVCGDTEPMARVQDVMMALLAQAAPGDVIAAQYGSVNHILIGGRRSDGTGYVVYEAPCGGIGAGDAFDGADAIVMLMGGDVKNLPIEVLEHAYPIRCLGYRLRPDSGGPGRRRGGLGLERTYQLLENGSASLISDRCVFSPFGLFGGQDGLGGSWTLDAETEQERPLAGEFRSKATAVSIAAGTVVRIRTAGGGGYGDPLERDPERVRRDVVRGWVTAGAARDEYGVVLAPTAVAVADPDLVRLEAADGMWLSLLGAAPAPVRLRVVAGARNAGPAVSPNSMRLLGLPAEGGTCLVMPVRNELA
jgi:N-methylhydantoinase B